MSESQRIRRSATRRSRSGAVSAGLIAVDVGNSDTVVGLFSGSELSGFWRFTTRPDTADELGLRLAALGRGCGMVTVMLEPSGTAAVRRCRCPGRRPF